MTRIFHSIAVEGEEKKVKVEEEEEEGEKLVR